MKKLLSLFFAVILLALSQAQPANPCKSCFPSSTGHAGQFLQTNGFGGLSWQAAGGAGSLDSNQVWKIHGNAGTGDNNYIGTTDNVDLKFLQNSQPAGRIGANNTSFGSLSNLTNAGTFNTAFGRNTMSSISAGVGNTTIGNNADVVNATSYYATSIGDNAIADNYSIALGVDAVADVDSTLGLPDNIDSIQAKLSGVDGGVLAYNANSNHSTYRHIDSLLPYRKYVALLTQSANNAPTATVLENTIGTINWAYDGTGIYSASVSNNAFGAASKAYLTLDLGTATATGYGVIFWDSSSEVHVNTYDRTTGLLVDDNLNFSAIEIRIYK